MLNVKLRQSSFRPGEIITGQVEWSDIERLEGLDVRLIWYTAGKGDRDVDVALSQTLDRLEAKGSREFEFVAPHYPPSFSGTLISLIWAVEVITFPGRDAESVSLVIGPEGRELVATGTFAKKTSVQVSG